MWITYAIMIGAIINYILIQNEKRTNPRLDAEIKYGAMSKFLIDRGQWYRLITAGFVHFSIPHLIMNLYAMYNLGSGLERLFEPWQFVILVFGSIILGNLMAYWLGNENSVSGGLSSGLYGLMACYLVILYRIYGLEGILSSTSTIMMLGINIMMNFLPGVGWQAHLGGACFGIIYTVLFVLR